MSTNIIQKSSAISNNFLPFKCRIQKIHLVQKYNSKQFSSIPLPNTKKITNFIESISVQGTQSLHYGLFTLTETGTESDTMATVPHCIGFSVQYEYLHTILYKPFLPAANYVCGGYVFTPVCQSFCSQWGEGWYPSMQWANSI